MDLLTKILMEMADNCQPSRQMLERIWLQIAERLRLGRPDNQHGRDTKGTG